MDFYRGKNVLVTGGSGMIGQALCPMLVELGANVTVASLDDQSRSPLNTSFQKLDLRSFENCLSVASGKDIVFHLLASNLNSVCFANVYFKIIQFLRVMT